MANRLSRTRKLVVRILALLGLLLFAFFFSIVALNAVGVVRSGVEGSPSDPPPSAEARLGAAHPGETVHVVGAVAVLALGVLGLVALIARPERPAYAYEVLASFTGIILTLPLVGDPDNVGGQAGPVDPVLLVLVLPSMAAGLLATPWGRRDSGEKSRPRLLVLAAVAAIPLTLYGIDQALLQRNTYPPTADPHHNAHWWVMSIVAFMTLLTVAAAALSGAGWRIGALMAYGAALGVGAASLAANSSASAIPVGWAIAAIVWAAVGLWLTIPRRERA